MGTVVSIVSTRSTPTAPATSFINLCDVPGFATATAGLVLAAILGTATLVTPPSGALLDHFRPKPILIGGNLTSALGYAGFAFVDRPWQAFACAIVGGAGIGALLASFIFLVTSSIFPLASPFFRASHASARRSGTRPAKVLSTRPSAASCTMAAKQTPQIIPMCHTLLLTGVDIAFDLHEEAGAGVVEIEATVRTVGKTGAEMEALTAVSVAALTIYDMCKAIDREMTITEIQLARKSGGKSGDFVRGAEPPAG